MRKKDPLWFKQCFNKAFTSDEVIAKIRALSDKDFLELMVRLQPKEHKIDQTSSIMLVINGLKQQTALDGTIRPALPAAEIIDPEDPDNIE